MKKETPPFESDSGLGSLEIKYPGAIDLLIAGGMSSAGYNLKVLEENHDRKSILATGDAKNVFVYARSSVEAELIKMHISIGESADLANERFSDRLYYLKSEARGLTENDLNIAIAYGSSREITRLKENKWINEDWKNEKIAAATKRLEDFGIDRPQERIRDVVSKLIHIGEQRAAGRGESFTFDAYNRGDLESGFLEKRIRKITNEIIELYGLEAEAFVDLPELDFVDYDTFSQRIAYIYTDGVSFNDVVPSSYYAPPGPKEFGGSGHLISIFYENQGDQTLIEEVLHWMHQVSMGKSEYKRTERNKNDFFNGIVSEALAFTTTKSFLPIRYRHQLEGDIVGLLEGFTQKDLEELVLQSGENFDVELLKLVGEKSFNEWFGAHRFRMSLGTFPQNLIHTVGYFLGERLYEEMKQGNVLPTDARNIFFKPGESSEHYKQLARLITKE